jgi:hypothetical protein
MQFDFVQEFLDFQLYYLIHALVISSRSNITLATCVEEQNNCDDEYIYESVSIIFV